MYYFMYIVHVPVSYLHCKMSSTYLVSSYNKIILYLVKLSKEIVFYFYNIEIKEHWRT